MEGSERVCGMCAQVNTLLKGLEKIAASADIPMLVAGDFNSVPGSAAHTLLLKRGVEPSHPVCCADCVSICLASDALCPPRSDGFSPQPAPSALTWFPMRSS